MADNYKPFMDLFTGVGGVMKSFKCGVIAIVQSESKMMGILSDFTYNSVGRNRLSSNAVRDE